MAAAFRAQAMVSGVAPTAPDVSQCDPPAFPTGAGYEVTCNVTIQNTITAGGAIHSTVTAKACLAVAGVLPPSGCTTTVTTSNQLVTGVDQCNGIVFGGGSNVTCNVTVINTIPVGTPTTGVTVNQCIGSGQGGGTQPTVVCNPIGNTTNATIDQCNGSGNGGGASMRVTCTVAGGATATPVTIRQCDGSSNGGGSTVTCTTSVTNNFVTTPKPSLTIKKTAAPATVTAVGQTVDYSFVVTNTGNVTLTNINVADTQTAPSGPLTTGPTCPTTTLATGISMTCTATYVVTSADLTHGSINDSAIANGTPPTGARVHSPPATATVTATPPHPMLTILKSAAPTTVTAVGQIITYTFVVTNTGNVTLTNINVADTQTAPALALTAGPTCPAPTLAAGATETCAATYEVTQADLANGSIHDSALAHGTPAAGAPVPSSPSTATVTATPVTPAPSLTIKKTASPTTVSAVGQTITYTFVVTNTGNVTLTTINVVDLQTAPAVSLTAPPTCPTTTLAPGASVTCTGTYVVTQADLDHGSVADSAVANGIPAGGGPVPSTPSGVTVTVTPTTPVSTPGGGTGSTTTVAAGNNAGDTAGGGTGGDGATLASSGSGSGPLAFTGLALAPLLGVASLLLLTGTALVVLAQRRRRLHRS